MRAISLRRASTRSRGTWGQRATPSLLSQPGEAEALVGSSRTKAAAEIAATVLVACSLLGAAASPAAHAASLANGLADAEANAAGAEVQIAEARSLLGPARASFTAAKERATPVDKVAAAAKVHLEQLESTATDRQTAARAQIARLEAQHDEEADEHDEEVANGIGFAAALLVAALIALAWDFFRASAAVAWLVGRDRNQAIGICVGGGLLAVIVGLSLGGGGLVKALGSLIFGLGLVLPTAFLLARHSAEVQRRRAKPIFRRERLPSGVSRTVTGVFGAIFLIATLGAALSSGPDPAPIGSSTRADAGPLSLATRARIAAAHSRAEQLSRQAAWVDRMRAAAKRELVDAESALSDGEDQLAAASSSADRYSAKLVAVEEREARQAEHEEAIATEEAETAEEEAAEAAAEACNANYSGCLDPTASDYDCEGGSGDGPLYTGTVEVTGYDEYGLDEDGDGIGCDP